MVAVLAGGLRVCAPPSGRLATIARLTLFAGLTFVAVGQFGEGVVGLAGHHDDGVHTVPMVVSGLAAPVVLVGARLTVLAATASLVRRTSRPSWPWLAHSAQRTR